MKLSMRPFRGKEVCYTMKEGWLKGEGVIYKISNSRGQIYRFESVFVIVRVVFIKLSSVEQK